MKGTAFAATTIAALAAGTTSAQSAILTFGFTDLQQNPLDAGSEVVNSASLGSVGDVTLTITDDSGFVPLSSLTAGFDEASSSFQFDFDGSGGSIQIFDVDGDVITIELGAGSNGIFSTEFAVLSVSYSDNGDGIGDGTFDGSDGGSFAAAGLFLTPSSNVGGAVTLLPGEFAPTSLPRLVQGFAGVQIPTPGSIALGLAGISLLGFGRRR